MNHKTLTLTLIALLSMAPIACTPVDADNFIAQLQRKGVLTYIIGSRELTPDEEIELTALRLSLSAAGLDKVSPFAHWGGACITHLGRTYDLHTHEDITDITGMNNFPNPDKIIDETKQTPTSNTFTASQAASLIAAHAQETAQQAKTAQEQTTHLTYFS